MVASYQPITLHFHTIIISQIVKLRIIFFFVVVVVFFYMVSLTARHG